MTAPWFPAGLRARRLLAPEVVQTSSMDCGPAALKCLLEGHGLAVSYGRLREACQTSVDGTSIDTIEAVAVQLGLAAEQVLIPRDFVCRDHGNAFPSIVVVRHADNSTHFVVVWARFGNWLQIMDPAVGRRWVSLQRFEDDIFTHEQSVAASDWRAWCDSDDFLMPMHLRLAGLGFERAEAEGLIQEAAAYPGWFGFGALDASVRLCASLASAGGLACGPEAVRVATALFRDTVHCGHDIFAIIPAAYWSAQPDLANTDPSRQMLRIRGGVVLRTAGHDLRIAADALAALPPELAAAVSEPTPRPLRRFVAMVRQDGEFRPGMLATAIFVQALLLLMQAAVFRGLLDIAQYLELPAQRVFALFAVGLLVLLAGALDVGLAAATIGQGRRLEARLRRALLAKLPRLKDRYFQSRPITDMADRSHNIQVVRGLPALALQGLQAICELVLTLLAILWIAPGSIGWAIALAVGAAVLPAALQPLINERDLRVRNHGGALHGFYLDALLGLAPIRAHRAQKAVTRQHESLLVEWTRAARGLAVWSLISDGIQMLFTTGLAAILLMRHFSGSPVLAGADLLLVFWTLRLPVAAERLASLAHVYPAMRNALLRQMEPLDAPQEATDAVPSAPRSAPGPARIEIQGGRLIAGGHTILSGIDLTIAAGEHVAIVGRSGAGKSSLLGLLLGWHRLEEGRLLVDGEALTAAHLGALRLATAWVDPQVQLWNRSLLDNLTYAVDDQDLSRVRSLIETSGLIGLSSRLPLGLQTPLGDGGGLLSGGEGQRVRLGRALLSPSSRLALLDEPFRGLDRAQRRDLLQGARRWWADTTMLCVTHDIAETLEFPRVLVIEDGQLVEDGDPRRLAAGTSRYRALLDAETHVTQTMWQAARWRRWRVADGRVCEVR